MRNPNRIKRILKKIETLWKENPDQRMYQLLSNYTSLGNKRDPFFKEDDELEKELDASIDLFEKFKKEEVRRFKCRNTK